MDWSEIVRAILGAGMFNALVLSACGMPSAYQAAALASGSAMAAIFLAPEIGRKLAKVK